MNTNHASWTRLLTDDDEWVVRTALANIASDLENLAARLDGEETSIDVACRQSAQRYREVLARIELADVDDDDERAMRGPSHFDDDPVELVDTDPGTHE